MNPEDKILELENKVNLLEKKVGSLFSQGEFPIEVQDALLKRGFLQYDKTIYFEGGAGGNTFTSIIVKYKDKSDQIGVGNKLIPFSANATNNTCYSSNHGLTNGQTVYFYTTDTLPAGLDSLILTYTITNAATNSFQVDGGSGIVDITSNGVGTQYVQVY